MDESGDVRIVEVKATFRHSAGRLGTRFLTAIRDEARLLGWRTGGRVLVPPKDLGLPGEWVAIGPGAVLEAYAPSGWTDAAADGSVLALIKPDGADTALLARLRAGAETAEALPVGRRLVARFAEERRGAITDLWFEPA